MAPNYCVDAPQHITIEWEKTIAQVICLRLDVHYSEIPLTANRLKISDNSEEKPGCTRTVLLIVVIALVTSLITVWAAMAYLFPKEFKPVSLSDREEQALEEKLASVDTSRRKGKESLAPERYSEEGASREIKFTEREINGMLAKNTDLADKLAIDLSDDLASAKLLIPLDPDFPFLGGKTLKVSAGLELRYDRGNPVVVLKGISLWGVPIPNAWLGGIKNVDLIKEFGNDEGFWKTFSAGIENIRVEEGRLTIKLKE